MDRNPEIETKHKGIISALQSTFPPKGVNGRCKIIKHTRNYFKQLKRQSQAEMIDTNPIDLCSESINQQVVSCVPNPESGQTPLVNNPPKPTKGQHELNFNTILSMKDFNSKISTPSESITVQDYIAQTFELASPSKQSLEGRNETYRKNKNSRWPSDACENSTKDYQNQNQSSSIESIEA